MLPYDPELAVGTTLERVLTAVGSERMKQEIPRRDADLRAIRLERAKHYARN